MCEIQWLFFDLGSTLIDESECYRRRILHMIDGSAVSYEEFFSAMMDFYRQSKKGDKLAAARYGCRLPPWESQYEVLYPDTKDCLERLRHTYRLGVIANQDSGTEERLRAFGIDRYFDVVIASAEEGIAKPDPKIFRLALSRAGCLPEQAVMIGDRLDNDITPAKKLGFTTVRVMRGFGRFAVPFSEEETPDYTVDNLRQLILRLKGFCQGEG